MKQIAMYFFALLLVACNFSDKQAKGKENQKEEERVKVLISTNVGDITIELFNETPLHRDNFVKLVEEEFYDGTLFHRVINNFMIQGGDPESKEARPGARLGMGGPGYTIPAEFVEGLYHQKGVLSAARQGDQMNPEKESSGSQFYIVHGRVFTHEELAVVEQRTGRTLSPERRKIYTSIGGVPHLDHDYTVFGRVIKGLEVLDAIAAVKTDRADRPTEDIKMEMRILD